MKTKKSFRYIIATIRTILIILIVAIPIIFISVKIVSLTYPSHYVKNCLYSNKDELEQIPGYLRNIFVKGDTHIIIDEDSNYDEINMILSGLREQYQNDSDYPVFAHINVYFDNDGDLHFILTAKKNKIENVNVMYEPDIICYYLGYMDENYDGDTPIKNAKPFCGNWYTWSGKSYSG